MSEWEELGILAKIERILGPISRESQEHHFGSPFMTTYQIAIDYTQQFPEDLQRMEYEIGGKDTGVHFSLAQYLAQQLSTKIKSGEISTIEGRFISNRYVSNFIFDSNEIHVESSITGKHASLSMFRLIRI